MAAKGPDVRDTATTALAPVTDTATDTATRTSTWTALGSSMRGSRLWTRPSATGTSAPSPLALGAPWAAVTALTLSLCKFLRDTVNMGVVTNDIFTREDCEFLIRNEALEARRITCLETGGCPHAAIREDITGNMVKLEELTKTLAPELLLLESGGDNLAANFSRELDFTIYVVDVAGGDKVPRKGGPGVTQSDLLIVNKTDLAQAVGADLDVMRETRKMRGDGPTVFAQVKHMVGVPEIAKLILDAREPRVRRPQKASQIVGFGAQTRIGRRVRASRWGWEARVGSFPAPASRTRRPTLVPWCVGFDQ